MTDRWSDLRNQGFVLNCLDKSAFGGVFCTSSTYLRPATRRAQLFYPFPIFRRMKKVILPGLSLRHWLLPALLLGAGTAAQAQNNVGIGTASPSASAVLDVSSTTQGLLAPRMTQAQRNAIGSPSTGLLVFQLDNTPGFYFYNGAAWTAVAGSGGNGSNGTNGTNGLNALIRTTTEAAGGNCGTGGTKLEAGLDSNANGTLDAAEVNATLTRYVCNGANGTNGTNGTAGTNGTNGTNGLNALVRTTVEAAGGNCGTGGTKIETGQDANANGTLDASEIAATRYVCNGTAGTNGTNGTNGQGVPTGGTAGQVLTKVNGTDYNTQWTTPSASASPPAYPSIELNTSVTSSQTITQLAGSNSYTPLLFSASNNTNAAFTGGNTWNGSVFTVGATGAGWYQVVAQVAQVNSVGGSNQVGVQFFLDKNNAIGNTSTSNGIYPYALSTYDFNSSGGNYRSRSGLSTIIYLAAGDQLTLRGQSWSTTTSAYTSTDGSSNLTIVRLK